MWRRPPHGSSSSALGLSGVGARPHQCINASGNKQPSLNCKPLQPKSHLARVQVLIDLHRRSPVCGHCSQDRWWRRQRPEARGQRRWLQQRQQPCAVASGRASCHGGRHSVARPQARPKCSAAARKASAARLRVLSCRCRQAQAQRAPTFVAGRHLALLGVGEFLRGGNWRGRAGGTSGGGSGGGSLEGGAGALCARLRRHRHPARMLARAGEPPGPGRPSQDGDHSVRAATPPGASSPRPRTCSSPPLLLID